MPQVIDDCHELLKWLIPLLDKFPRTRRFTLGERLESGLLAGHDTGDVLVAAQKMWFIDNRLIIPGDRHAVDRHSRGVSRAHRTDLWCGKRAGAMIHHWRIRLLVAVLSVPVWAAVDVTEPHRDTTGEMRPADRHPAGPVVLHMAGHLLGHGFRDKLSCGSEGPEMVVIPAGRFMMGCASGSDCEVNEKPAHEVVFALSKYDRSRAG